MLAYVKIIVYSFIVEHYYINCEGFCMEKEHNPEIDFLTGLYLRGGLHSYTEEVLREAKAKNKKFSIVLFDLDHFKRYNDNHGHLLGDEILKFVGSSLRLSFRETKRRFFRYGGDEFLIVFPEKDSEETYKLVAQFKHNISCRPFLLGDKFYKIGVSFGISTFPTDAETIEELIEKADEAMYFSKKFGRNYITQFSRMKFIALRAALIGVAIFFLLVNLFLLFYNYSLKSSLQETLHKVKVMRVIAEPRNLDIITLRNGNVLKGKVVREVGDNVVLNVYLTQGSASMTLSREEIFDIKYGSNKSRKRKSRKQK